MEFILMAYPKNSSLGQMGHLGPRMSHSVLRQDVRSHNSGLFHNDCKDCFIILHNERGQERHGNGINGFSERNLILNGEI